MHRYSPAENPDFVIDYLSERIKVTNALLGVGLVISWHIGFAVQGLYVSHRLRPLRLELKEIGRAVLFSSLALLVGASLGSWPTINLRTVAMFGLVSFGLIGSMRLVLRLNLRRLRRRGHNVKTLLIMGGGSRGRQFAERVNARQDLGYRLLGYVDSDPAFAGRELEGAPWMGTIEDLPRILANEVIDEVAIALPIKSQYMQIEAAVMLLEEQGITTHLLSDLFPQKLARSRPTDFDGVPIVSLHSAPLFSWRTEAKRIFDFVSAAFLLLIAAPVLVLVAMAIKLESDGPIFFVQERVGLNKRRFRMLKFRTMQRDAEARMKEIEHLNEKTGPIFK
ncbi:MAG: sugar transferase, partial [Candidatus Binatia bacterium]